MSAGIDAFAGGVGDNAYAAGAGGAAPPAGNIPRTLLSALAPITLVTGHYGTGKTNFALNLALDLSRFADVTLVDLDIVNPYFRSSEYEALFEGTGVRVVGPVMANSSLDTPSLSAAVDGVLDWATAGLTAQETAKRGDGHLFNGDQDVADAAGAFRPRLAILDVGGDDAGAMALGRYRARIAQHNYAMLYVVNANRNLTQAPEDALEILSEIEVAAGLHATGVVNNTHLRTQTTAQTVIGAADFGRQVSALAGAPLVAQTVPDWCVGQIGDALDAETNYPIQMYVKTPWE